MFKRFCAKAYDSLVWFMNSVAPMLCYLMGLYITYTWLVVGKQPTFLGFLFWWIFVNNSVALIIREIKR